MSALTKPIEAPGAAPRLLRTVLSGRRGRRGVTSVVVAASGTILIGMAGLAAEGGTWYLALRNARTAADLAAIAGATALDSGVSASPAALDTASRNGFAQGGRNTVTIATPPSSGTFSGNAAAVEVTIAQTQQLSLTRMFLGSAPTVRTRAVAAANVDEEVCLYALNQLSLGGNSTTQASRCALAAGSGGINVYGNASVRAAQLITTGTCSGCASGDVWTDNTRTVRPLAVSNRAASVPDPFAGLQGWVPTPPACRSGTINGTASITPAQGAICSNVSIGPQHTLTLAPGIYYFNNADLDLRGTINGNGVTLVFTGDTNRVGTITINSQANGTLRGPTSALIPGHPESAGLVLYRDARATNNGSAKQVTLNGGASMALNGGVYLPTSDVVSNGHSAVVSTCLSVVGWNLSYSGSESTDINLSGCSGYAPYPTIRTVRLVE